MTYQVKNPEFSETFNRLGIFANGKEVGWIRNAPTYNPIAYIYDKEHKLDKLSLSKAIKRRWPTSKGTYFLITEIVELTALLNTSTEPEAKK